MSTLKTTNLQHPSAASPAIVLDADGGMSGAFPSPNRNLLYNGAMQVHQRGTSATGITSAGYWTADRWVSPVVGVGAWTQTVEADGPTGSGFTKSLKMECTTSDTPTGTESVSVRQYLEGQDLQCLKKGTSDAESLTLSFWVKSNVTGTYVAWLNDADNTRHIAASYTIASSGTWERKTITFAGDATGAFDNDNALSLLVTWWLSAGSDRTSGTLATSWESIVTANTAVGQTNLAAATSNYWQVTGVQLEAGTAATPFEFKSFDQELWACKRYFQKSFAYDQLPINNTTPNSIIHGNYAINHAGGTTSGTSYNQGRATLEREMRTVPSSIILYQPNGSAGNSGQLGKFGDVGNGSTTTGFNAGAATASTKTIIVPFNNGNGFSNGGNPQGVNWVASAEL
jgi:hypothetical protein